MQLCQCLPPRGSLRKLISRHLSTMNVVCSYLAHKSACPRAAPPCHWGLGLWASEQVITVSSCSKRGSCGDNTFNKFPQYSPIIISYKMASKTRPQFFPNDLKPIAIDEPTLRKVLDELRAAVRRGITLIQSRETEKEDSGTIFSGSLGWNPLRRSMHGNGFLLIIQ